VHNKNRVNITIITTSNLLHTSRCWQHSCNKHIMNAWWVCQKQPRYIQKLSWQNV